MANAVQTPTSISDGEDHHLTYSAKKRPFCTRVYKHQAGYGAQQRLQSRFHSQYHRLRLCAEIRMLSAPVTRFLWSNCPHSGSFVAPLLGPRPWMHSRISSPPTIASLDGQIMLCSPPTLFQGHSGHGLHHSRHLSVEPNVAQKNVMRGYSCAYTQEPTKKM